MINKIIAMILSGPTVSFLIMGAIASLISLSLKTSRSKDIVIETFTAYFFLFSIGVAYLVNFVMHVFFAEFTAKFIGWANSPFRLDFGFASLGMGIVGLIAFRRNPAFRAAAFLPPALLLWGAAGGHIYKMVRVHNVATGNAGAILWTDLLLPVIGFALLFAQWKYPIPELGGDCLGSRTIKDDDKAGTSMSGVVLATSG